MTTQRKLIIAAAAAMVVHSAQISQACQLPPVSDLSLNVSSQHGSSTNGTINTAVSSILADIQQVRYDASNSYINATGIPSHPIGPWPGNPNTASNQNWLYRIPLSPAVNNGTKTATGLGSIG